MYILLFCAEFFLEKFLLLLDFAKKFNFSDSKSRAQELSNDVSFFIFGHQPWDLEGEGQIGPPPTVSWFSSTPVGIWLPDIFPKRKTEIFLSKLTSGFQDYKLQVQTHILYIL